MPERQSLDQIPPEAGIAETGSRSPGLRCLRKKAEPVSEGLLIIKKITSCVAVSLCPQGKVCTGAMSEINGC